MVDGVMRGRRYIVPVFLLILVLDVLWLRVQEVRRNRPHPQPISCISILQEMDAAKQVWRAENHKTTDDVPTMTELTNYMKLVPVCPKGGVYTIGHVGTPPKCSIKGHELPK